MKKTTPKKIYEDIILCGKTPEPEHLKLLKGTRWEHKLNGTTPEKADIYRSFKAHFESEAPSISFQDRSELANSIVDKVEDKFGLHFSDLKANPVNHNKFDEIKSFVENHIKHSKAADSDKHSILKVVNKADDIYELMIKLNSLTS